MINIGNQPSKEITDLLTDAIIGTPRESISYQLSEVANKINFIPAPVFLTIKKRSKLIATCCRAKGGALFREKKQKPSIYDILHFCQLTKKGLSSARKRKPQNNGILKKEIQSLFEGRGGSYFPVENSHLFYAYVDPANQRSLSLCNLFGCRAIRTFSTIIYSRHRPAKHYSVSRCQPYEKPLVVSYLQEFYRDYSMFSTDNLFYQDNYYVLKGKNGDIIAGVQANRVNWKIKGLPGFLGKYLLGLIPWLPFINRYFDRNFTFISLEAILYKEGFEGKLDKLFESVLAINQVYTALVWADDHSELYRSVKKLKPGFFGSFFNLKPASVIVRTNGLSAEEEKQLRELPAYISVFDLT